jgi:hypothetical protein
MIAQAYDFGVQKMICIDKKKLHRVSTNRISPLTTAHNARELDGIINHIVQLVELAV